MDASPPGSDAASFSCCYCSLLGIHRNAYRRLAFRWHPDRWGKEPAAASCEAKQKFQRALRHERVSVPFTTPASTTSLDDDVQGFADFMREILATMEQLKPEKPDTLEDLQRMLAEIVNMGSSTGGANAGGRRGPSDAARRRRGGGPTTRR